ncbi:conserved exported hypothetical protein [uncultured delta proteobacterium]|uniref:Thioredoxin domain-containing protein n=1 Tax=uncultured delta proteobacterium TaxID=34034 RepID=A0A212IYY0_9DELT|nr:conserved exported hypothetical protein [uncultured delta proteobacterium]
MRGFRLPLLCLLVCAVWLHAAQAAVAASPDAAPAPVDAGSAHAGHAPDTGTLADQVPRLSPEQQKDPNLAIPGGGEATTRKQTALGALSPEERAVYARVDEKGGAVIPEGILFKDENGKEVDIRSLMNVPVVIAPVYYSCPGTCHLLLSALARILPQVGLEPVKDYRVVSVSFDDTDTPELAAQRKRNFMAATDFTYPADGWVFLSGSKESVSRLMDAIGFRYKRLGRDFIHPTVLVVTAPGGTVSRYLYGQSFMPFDITMSLNEAAKGHVGLSLKRALAYCFTYDAENRRYVFDFMRLAGGIILFGAAVLLFVLLWGGRKKKKA